MDAGNSELEDHPSWDIHWALKFVLLSLLSYLGCRWFFSPPEPYVDAYVRLGLKNYSIEKLETIIKSKTSRLERKLGALDAYYQNPRFWENEKDVLQIITILNDLAPRFHTERFVKVSDSELTNFSWILLKVPEATTHRDILIAQLIMTVSNIRRAAKDKFFYRAAAQAKMLLDKMEPESDSPVFELWQREIREASRFM